MKRFLISRNTPAIVLSILALTAAVAGAAVAGNAHTAKKGVTPGKVKKLARGAVIKANYTLTIDFGNLPPNLCETQFIAPPVKLATTDAIITTPGNISPPNGVVTETVNNAAGIPGQVAGLAIEACNQTAAPINPSPGPYRFTIIGA